VDAPENLTALVALSFSLMFIDPPILLFLLFLAYGLSGYALFIWRKRHWRKAPSTPAPAQAGEKHRHEAGSGNPS